MKKETNEKFKNPAHRKKYYQDELNKVEIHLATIQKDHSDNKK